MGSTPVVVVVSSHTNMWGRKLIPTEVVRSRAMQALNGCSEALRCRGCGTRARSTYRVQLAEKTNDEFRDLKQGFTAGRGVCVFLLQVQAVHYPCTVRIIICY